MHVNLFSSPVTVGLLTYPALSATGIFGGLANGLLNFANITGSALNDVLIGDNNPNVINGGAGNNTLEGAVPRQKPLDSPCSATTSRRTRLSKPLAAGRWIHSTSPP